MMNIKKTWVWLFQIPLAWEWLKSGFDKITEGGLGSDFAHSLPNTLKVFTAQTNAKGQIFNNPHKWYVDSFIAWAKDNPTLFGYLVEYGEFILGLLLFVTIAIALFSGKKLPAVLVVIACFGLIGGIFLNLNFYLASAWPASAASTKSINSFMIFFQAILLVFYLSKLFEKEEQK